MGKLSVVLALLGAVCVFIVLIEPDDNEEVVGRMKPLSDDRQLPYVLAKPLALPDCPHVFPELARVDGRNTTLLLELARTGRPFVAEGVVPVEQGALDPHSSFDLAEEVKLSRFVRRLPVTPANSRLYPTDRVEGPLELFIKGDYQDYLQWFKSMDGQQIFMAKHSIDFSVPLLSALDRAFYNYFHKHVPVPIDGSAKAYDPSLRIQRSPFTYPVHFDCCDNWAFQAHGGGGKRFYLHPPDESLGGGWEEVDRLHLIHNESSRADGSWRKHWLQATLRPGDGIFIPLGWYHGVISDGSTKFCLSYNSPVDWVSDQTYQARVAACELQFAEFYPAQTRILDTGVDYHALSLWQAVQHLMGLL